MSKSITAQTLVFAELTGSPAVSTTGWNLTGATYLGDTGGDANAFSDEIILTNAVNGSSGGIFIMNPWIFLLVSNGKSNLIFACGKEALLMESRSVFWMFHLLVL